MKVAAAGRVVLIDQQDVPHRDPPCGWECLISGRSRHRVLDIVAQRFGLGYVSHSALHLARMRRPWQRVVTADARLGRQPP
jgi:hypothetical protein